MSYHSTAQLTDSLLVVTAERSYVISPHDQQHFLQAWQDRRALGPTRQWPHQVQPRWPLNTLFFSDAIVTGLFSTALLLCLALFAYLLWILPELPADLPLQFDLLGQFDRTSAKSALLALPFIGMTVIAVNALLGTLIYYRDHVAAYLLWGSLVVMQLGLWGATLTIIP